MIRFGVGGCILDVKGVYDTLHSGPFDLFACGSEIECAQDFACYGFLKCNVSLRVLSDDPFSFCVTMSQDFQRLRE